MLIKIDKFSRGVENLMRLEIIAEYQPIWNVSKQCMISVLKSFETLLGEVYFIDYLYIDN